MPDGVFLVDKPAGWTSHDVVARVRRLAQTRKVGHAGTLDPMATGLLVVGIGRATRLLTFLVGCDKEYLATIRLGQATSTDDAEGELLTCVGAGGVTQDAVSSAVAKLTGELDQVPSAVSAIKVDGKRSYQRVRRGEQVDLPARRVHVHDFSVLAVRAAVGTDGRTPVLDIDVRVVVSSGTYVRALARDLGDSLGCGGHLVALRRVRVGGFGIAEAAGLDDFEPGDVLPLLGLAEAARAGMPARTLTEQEAGEVVFGRGIPSEMPGRAEPVAALSPAGDLVAVLDERAATARFHMVVAGAADTRGHGSTSTG